MKVTELRVLKSISILKERCPFTDTVTLDVAKIVNFLSQYQVR